MTSEFPLREMETLANILKQQPAAKASAGDENRGQDIPRN